ncbi:MAG: MraY family glycosyltransferase [Bacteroidetes bacterium]|nr:MraY family glycosyltransferase [Bacteroidota bacterium]
MTESYRSLLISYAIFFLVTLVLSTLVNSLFLKFSRTLGIRNKNDTIIRWSAESKPSFGGISFYITFLFSLSVYSIVFEQSLNFRNLQFIGFLLATTLGFLMGLYDDAYNTKVWLKLFTQISCGLILISTGTYINFFDSQILNYALTLFWVVGIMNSINMLDNMDAITSLVSLFIFLTTLVTITLKGDFSNPYYLIMLGLVASLTGFLFYNWHPSKMYMGDTGSQFLGVILATVGILYFWNPYKSTTDLYISRQVVLILIVFAIPLIDTTTVFIKRMAIGQSPFVGGKDHTTHHLSYLGLSDNKVALVFMMISLVCSILGITIIFCYPTWSLLPAIGYLLFFILIFTGLFIIANKNKS